MREYVSALGRSTQPMPHAPQEGVVHEVGRVQVGRADQHQLKGTSMFLFAYSGQPERPDRFMVNAPIGDRERSEATLGGQWMVELPPFSGTTGCSTARDPVAARL
jgi:hypothetical protein